MTHVSEGTLPSGETFKFPDTLSVTAALVTPASLKRPGSIIWVASWVAIALTPILFFTGRLPLWFFVVQHISWRLAYNIGIGTILYTQSKDRRFELFFQFISKHPLMKWFLEASVVFSDNSSYLMKDYPLEFNAWMFFRQIENIILANDLISYAALTVVCFDSESITFAGLPRIALGVGSIVFSLWSKTDAHRVISEFAWYWGDFFFLVKQSLLFDGVFQMFPHPMYTVGYAFIYGAPLLCNSFTLFWVGAFAHICQILFLVLVEDPHMDKVYPPEEPSEAMKKSEKMLFEKPSDHNDPPYLESGESVYLYHFSVSRPRDQLVLAGAAIQVGIALVSGASERFYISMFVMFSVVLYGGLGAVLYFQGKNQWFSRQFASTRRAFYAWKTLHNFVASMRHIAFFICAVKCFRSDGYMAEAIRHNVIFVDAAFVALACNLYYFLSSIAVIGLKGHFFADFFIPDMPSYLTYEGVYRYFNSPSILLGVGVLYSVAIVSSNVYLVLAVMLSHLMLYAFTLLVERPFMLKKYPNVRDHGTFTSEVEKKWSRAIANYTKKKQ